MDIRLFNSQPIVRKKRDHDDGAQNWGLLDPGFEDLGAHAISDFSVAPGILGHFGALGAPGDQAFHGRGQFYHSTPSLERA